MSFQFKDNLHVLVVDDDRFDRLNLGRALKSIQNSFQITEAEDATEAIQKVAEDIFDCIFLDFNMPGKNGLDLTRHLRAQDIKTPVIILTGQGDERIAVELMKAGASDYLPKDELSPHSVSRLMRNAIQMYEAQVQIEKINHSLREKNAQLEAKTENLERQRHQIFLQKLRLQEASELKSKFLATVSHELRTPLNAVIGFSQILLSESKGPLSEAQRNMITRILANGKNQLELINDILMFSKAEAGRLDLQPDTVNLSQLIELTVEELKSLAIQKEIDLTVSFNLDDPTISNDAVRLRQILVNLLSNAIKFTQEGHVQIVVTAADPHQFPDIPDPISLKVNDTGCGISQEDQSHIFDAFHQVSQMLVRKQAGTGLGLAITDSIVKLMNGHIQVESEIGKGTTFEVIFPRKVEPVNTQP